MPPRCCTNSPLAPLILLAYGLAPLPLLLVPFIVLRLAGVCIPWRVMCHLKLTDGMG